VRDGRAVAASLARVGFFKELPLWWANRVPACDLVSEYGCLELVAAEHWRRQVTAALNSLSELPDRFQQVKYEDLVADPSAELENVRAFAWDSPFRDSVGFKTGAVKASSVDRWRQTLSPELQEQLNEALHTELVSLGYVG